MKVLKEGIKIILGVIVLIAFAVLIYTTIFEDWGSQSGGHNPDDIGCTTPEDCY